eukprot:scaffold15837_cov49-Cyclotella_meneghiniana.AAC.3
MASSNSSFDSAVDLCYNEEDLSESELMSQFQAILKTNPDVATKSDDEGVTLLHHAAMYRSPDFCKLLVDRNPDLVRTAQLSGWLPFHGACSGGNVETAKYLYKIYPESINIPDMIGGFYPLNLLMDTSIEEYVEVTGIEEFGVELTQFLLKHDRGAVSSPNTVGELPLHCACRGNRSLTIIKLVFNAYPEAIHIRDNAGQWSPLDFAVYYYEENMRHELLTFFERQINLERLAHIEREANEHGHLPIHRAVQNGGESVGAIKLMVTANPESIGITDSHGCTLLHLACQGGNLDTIDYLMGIMDRDSLKVTDFDGNLPLHHACMRGNCDVIPHIIEQSTFGVTLHNSDNQIPLQLLLFESESDRDSLEYVEAVRCLFQLNPVDTLKCLTGKDKECDVNKKRKRVG